MAYAEQVFWKLYEERNRKCNHPNIVDDNGIRKGKWEENIFLFYEEYIPKKFNPDKHTFRQIKAELQEKYGINFEGIPFINGRMDFSQTAIVAVDLDDIILASYEEGQIADLDGYDIPKSYLDLFQMPLDKIGEMYQKLFSKERRNANFHLADVIVSSKNVYIPGLGYDFTPEQLENWRKKNSFTWHESFNGYYLVPSVIHGNISHTGLVARESSLRKIIK